MKSRCGDDHIHVGKARTQMFRQRRHPARINTHDKRAHDRRARHHPADPAQEMASAFTTDEAIAEPPRVP